MLNILFSQQSTNVAESDVNITENTIEVLINRVLSLPIKDQLLFTRRCYLLQRRNFSNEGRTSDIRGLRSGRCISIQLHFNEKSKFQMSVFLYFSGVYYSEVWQKKGDFIQNSLILYVWSGERSPAREKSDRRIFCFQNLYYIARQQKTDSNV